MDYEFLKPDLAFLYVLKKTGYAIIGDVMFWNTNFPSLSTDKFVRELDVAIIGGGITGLSTAYYLRDSNLKVAVFEQGKIGMGVTSRSTAKITYLQGDIYQRLGDKAKSYYLSQKEAIWELLKIIEDGNISCELEEVPSILFCLNKENDSKIRAEKQLLESFGAHPYEVEHPNISSGIGISDSYVFHPLKFLSGLSNTLISKVLIYENTLVFDMKKENGRYLIHTTNGDFFAKNVVIANHYPFFLLPNLFPLKTYVQREYVNAAKVSHSSSFTAINIDSDLHSIRYYKDYLLYGSNRHRLTEKIDFGKHYDKSRSDFKRLFDKIPEVTWDNQDIVSHDLLPFIGRLDSHLYVGAAYRGWGMTNGVLSGKIISNFILYQAALYQDLFSPTRMNLGLAIHSFLGTFHYMKATTQAFLKKNNPSYVRINGVLHAIYEDEEHKIHKICLLCPHMKCHLVFNSYDKTWDCPCHGSRFSLDGKLIKGPATKSLTKTSIK